MDKIFDIYSAWSGIIVFGLFNFANLFFDEIFQFFLILTIFYRLIKKNLLAMQNFQFLGVGITLTSLNFLKLIRA